MWFTLSHLAEERELLRNVEVENSRLQSDCESLKLRLEGVQSEKASSSEEFEDFQKMRQVPFQLIFLLFLLQWLPIMIPQFQLNRIWRARSGASGRR